MPGFEMTPSGPVAIGETASSEAAGIVAGGAFVAGLQAARKAADEVQPSLPHPAMQAPPKSAQGKRAAKPKPQAEDLKPGDIIRLAKKRIRQLKKELKRHEKLKAELAELERLIDAAQNPPAPVRAIRAS